MYASFENGTLQTPPGQNPGYPFFIYGSLIEKNPRKFTNISSNTTAPRKKDGILLAFLPPLIEKTCYLLFSKNNVYYLPIRYVFHIFCTELVMNVNNDEVNYGLGLWTIELEVSMRLMY